MARVRSVTYQIGLNVPIGGSMQVARSGLLRDILPDQAFRVSTMLVSLRQEMLTGDTCSIVLSKNVPAAVDTIIDAMTTTHGVIGRWELTKVSAEGEFEGLSWVIPFTEPLDFDANDSLNLVVAAASTAIAIQQVYASISLEYEAG